MGPLTAAEKCTVRGRRIWLSFCLLPGQLQVLINQSRLCQHMTRLEC